MDTTRKRRAFGSNSQGKRARYFARRQRRSSKLGKLHIVNPVEAIDMNPLPVTGVFTADATKYGTFNSIFDLHTLTENGSGVLIEPLQAKLDVKLFASSANFAFSWSLVLVQGMGAGSGISDVTSAESINDCLTRIWTAGHYKYRVLSHGTSIPKVEAVTSGYFLGTANATLNLIPLYQQLKKYLRGESEFQLLDSNEVYQIWLFIKADSAQKGVRVISSLNMKYKPRAQLESGL